MPRKTTAPGPLLDRRALNRALLARQHLLQRAKMPALALIEHLVGMQAQVPTQPYVALWSRLAGFDPGELEAAVSERRALRMLLMRTTLHLVGAEDALGLRPVLQPVLERGFRTMSPFGRRAAGTDIEAVLAIGRESIRSAPHTQAELERALAERFPGADAQALAHGVRYLVPHVQPPPRGLWRTSGRAAIYDLEAFLGRALPAIADGDDARATLVRRYLAAFGPATAQDAQAWSGLTRLSAVFERLRPELLVFADERGRELFDLPDAPRPDAATPAPVRFLPEYDNVLLGHADRARIVDDEVRKRASAAPPSGLGTVLVDGRAAASWRLTEADGRARLDVRPHVALGKAAVRAMTAEGERLARFASDAEAHEVVVATPR